MAITFDKSNKQLDRALKTIPVGSQTFSKSYLAYPLGVSPLFAEKAKGCSLTDIDGNEFIDFVNGLLCVTLGYQDKDVDDAVKEQLSNGVTFSLPHRLETEVAEMMVELIPCAEMVRFGKNGSDTTSAAVRLARAYTDKEIVLSCGYHGWHDWYIGSTTRDLGVPNCVKQLTKKFEYNNLDSLEALFNCHSGEIACVIMEPMNVSYPQPEFLKKVRQLCDQHKALLIFDETITGFRFSLGGAQELFGVEPDIATFGKGLANGYPLSAVVGKKAIMMLMEDIFFSGTFGGETLSLAAAKAVLNKIQQVSLCEHLNVIGTHLKTSLQRIIESNNLQNYFKVDGHPSWSFLLIENTGKTDPQYITAYLQQLMHQSGLLVGSAHNLSFAHKKEHIDQLLTAYEEILPKIANAIEQNNIKELLLGEPTQAIFKVR